MEMDLEVLVNNKWSMCQQSALRDKRTSHFMGCIGPSTASWSKIYIALLFSVMLQPHLKHYVLMCSFQFGIL